MDSFGSFLREKRKQKDLSLQGLSNFLSEKRGEIGWYPEKSRLSLWENEKAVPSIKHRPALLAMAKILDMEPTEESEWLVKAGLLPLQTEELDMSAIDSTLSSMGERRRKAWYLHKYLGWDIGRISSKLKAASWDIRRDIEEVKDELEKLVGKVEDLPSVATQLKDELFVPAPETVPETLLTHDFSRPGPYSFSLREDDFKAIWRNLGYNIREFKVYKESSGILSGDVKINVVVSDYGNLELYCSVEEGRPLFEKLLSSLPGVKEQFDELKLDVGKYLTRCRRIYAEIHREAMEGTWQSPYEGVAGLHRGLQNWPPPLTPSFANLVYRLSILYHRTSGEYGLPDKSLYQIRPLTGYLPPFSGLYLGEINLANGPDRPFFPPPPFTKWVDRLEDLKDRHRNMIREWSLSPAIRELLELFNYCLDLVKALKLDDIIRGK